MIHFKKKKAKKKPGQYLACYLPLEDMPYIRRSLDRIVQEFEGRGIPMSRNAVVLRMLKTGIQETLEHITAAALSGPLLLVSISTATSRMSVAPMAATACHRVDFRGRRYKRGVLVATTSWIAAGPSGGEPGGPGPQNKTAPGFPRAACCVRLCERVSGVSATTQFRSPARPAGTRRGWWRARGRLPFRSSAAPRRR